MLAKPLPRYGCRPRTAAAALQPGAASPSSVHAGIASGSAPAATAQLRGLARERLVRFVLAGALEDPGHLGEEVGPPAGERGELGHRGGFLVAGELAPLRSVPRLSRQLRDEDTVSLRAIIGHAFEYHSCLLASRWAASASTSAPGARQPRPVTR